MNAISANSSYRAAQLQHAQELPNSSKQFSPVKALNDAQPITSIILHVKPKGTGKPEAAAESCGDVPFFTANDIGTTWCGKVIRPAVVDTTQNTAG